MTADENAPTEKERMLNGELYDPTDPTLREEREAARRLTRLFNRTAETDLDRRAALLEELFGSTGDDPFVEPPVRCDYGYNVRVGDGFFANFGCVFLDVRSIRFGDECVLGPGVHVYTATHPLDAAERTTGREYGRPVEFGDRAWVGGRSSTRASPSATTP